MLLTRAEQAWFSRAAARLDEVIACCERALEIPGAQTAEFASLRATAWLRRGQALEARGASEADFFESARSHGEAVKLLLPLGARAAPELAAAWMNRGGVLQRAGSPGTLAEAVRCYDAVIAGPGGVPARGATLGAAWLHRGCALLRTGTPEARAEAARSLREAAGVLEPLAEADLSARRDLSLAWANLGVALAVRGPDDEARDAAAQKQQFDEAAAAHRRAVETARTMTGLDGGIGAPDLAGLVFNFAELLARAGEEGEAQEQLREVLALTAAEEREDAACAELALRARHMLGLGLAGSLLAEREDGAARRERAAEATDLIEDALALAGHWAGRGVAMTALGAQLFEFGAWLYRTQQPRFLAEFLLEHMAGHPERRAAAEEALQRARRDIVGAGFSSLSLGGPGGAAEILHALGGVEDALRAAAD